MLTEAGGSGTWAWGTVTGRTSWSAQTYRLVGCDPGEPVTHALPLRCADPDRLIYPEAKGALF